MALLSGQRILLIAPVTYDYHQRIKLHLERLGAEVTLYTENLLSLGFRLSQNVSRSWFERYRAALFDKLLKGIEGRTFDQIFVIYGVTLNRQRVEMLRQLQPEARLVMYQWDSLKARDYSDLIDTFDSVYSFDRHDCESDSRLSYLPLFYSAESTEPVQTKFDLLFVGTLHSDRQAILEKLADQADLLDITYYFYLYVPLLKYIRRTGRVRPGRFIHFAPISNDELDRLNKSCRVILDINFIDQSGLTMRTFEALGAGKKLITTNSHIVREPFFDPELIAVLDRKQLKLDPDFVRTSGRAMDLSQYHIDNWLEKIVS